MPGVDTDAVHLVEVPRRFADMDLLGHVNNVRYLDYVTAGREALLRSHGVPLDEVVVRRHRVGFVAPMTFGRAPAQVRSWLVEAAGTTLGVAHEVVSHGHHGTDEPTVHLRTETLLEVPAGTVATVAAGASYAAGPTWRDLRTVDLAPRHTVPVDVRTRDLGRGAAARDDAVMEFFQEARVRYFMDLHTAGEEWGQVVVAHTDLDLLAPVVDAAGCEARSWIGHLGGSSFTVRSDLVDAAGAVLARTSVVLVCFDLATQAPAAMAPAQRARLERELQG